MSEPIQVSVEQRIVEACMHFQSIALPDVALRAAEQVILDWLGCVLIGADLAPAHAIANAHADEIGHGAATCFVGPSICHPGLAALISGTASHTIELDDIYSPALYHPGVCVISAALAACQLAKAKGDVFVRSVIAGYEISNRIGAGVNPEHYTYWHTTGTIGTFGATVASAIALALDEAQTASAIGNATSMAAGLQQAFRSDGMTKPLHAGRAAEAGLLAARISKAGFTGSSEMLSGPVGLVKAMSHGRDISDLFGDLFRQWTVAGSMYKRFSACGHIFSPVDVAMELSRQNSIDPMEVQSIEVSTYATALKVAGITTPASPFEAKFSIPFGVAAVLLGHDLTDPASFEKLFSDRTIAALIQKVRLVQDSEITAAFPQLRGARVVISMNDGKNYSGFASTRKGEPANPLSPEDLKEKFRRLVGATSHPNAANAWMKWVNGLAAGGSLGPDALPIRSQ